MLKKFVPNLLETAHTFKEAVMLLFFLFVSINTMMAFSSDSPELDRVYCVNRHYDKGNEWTEIDCSHRYAGIVITSEYEKNDRIKGENK